MTFAVADASHAKRWSLYRAIWRWHFYAGLLAIPFMLNLTVTGSIYLFKDEINRSLFHHRNVVTVAGTPQSPETLVAEAVAAVPGGSATSFVDAATDDASVVVKVKTADDTILVYLDPYSGRILDQVPSRQEFMYVDKKIHSLEYFGWLPNRLIEAVGGFAMILVITGFYLWWPRGKAGGVKAGGVLTVRGRPSNRIFWRDLHAVTGAVGGLFVFFLALTGMPWSGFWGSQLNQAISKAGIGYPAALWDEVPSSTVPTSDVIAKAGWTVENAPVPLSTPVSAAPIGLDRAVDTVRGLGITRGFETTLPGSETGVYTAAIFPDDLSRERTIHLDQYSGKPLVDLSYDQYGIGGKAIELGINIHQGQEWGLINQLAMLGACLSIVLASVAAVIMWWKRRPTGRIGVPPYPEDRRVYVGLWLAAAGVGILFPITGIAILVMVGLDVLVIRTIPPLRRAFA